MLTKLKPNIQKLIFIPGKCDIGSSFRDRQSNRKVQFDPAKKAAVLQVAKPDFIQILLDLVTKFTKSVHILY